MTVSSFQKKGAFGSGFGHASFAASLGDCRPRVIQRSPRIAARSAHQDFPFHANGGDRRPIAVNRYVRNPIGCAILGDVPALGQVREHRPILGRVNRTFAVSARCMPVISPEIVGDSFDGGNCNLAALSHAVTTRQRFRKTQPPKGTEMKTSSIFFAAFALISAPAHAEIFSMTCHPEYSTPYTVTYNSEARQAAIIGGKTGFVRTYHAFDVKDSKHILYVTTKAPGQTRTVYLAFDYSGINTDVSNIRVIDGASDKTDKCASDNFQEAALSTGRADSRRSPRETEDRAKTGRSIGHQDRRLLVINQTQADIIGIYASAVSSNEWGENMIVSSHHDPVPSGGRVLADMDDKSGSSNCRYDLKAVLSNGQVATRENVDICSVTDWTIGD
jgi:hypothetical protein